MRKRSSFKFVQENELWSYGFGGSTVLAMKGLTAQLRGSLILLSRRGNCTLIPRCRFQDYWLNFGNSRSLKRISKFAVANHLVIHGLEEKWVRKHAEHWQ